MALKLLACVMFTIWIVLLLLGKGGFVHLLLLGIIGVLVVEFMTYYRTRMTR